MKTHSQEIRKNGFTYTQLLRGRRSCIYEQRVTETIRYYEVFMIKVKPSAIVKGKVLEERERFPHNEAFGVWAWSCRDYDMAYVKFWELENTKFNK